MSETQAYDTRNFDLLRDDLEQLRNEARVEGVFAKRGSAGRTDEGASRRLGTGSLRASTDKGKQMARRMRAILRRAANDVSPMIDGTDFTEDGIKTFLSQLTAPRKKARAADRAIQNIHKFITAPPPKGAQTAVGVSVDRVRQLARLLERIEQHGWEQVRLALAEKRTAAKAAPPAQPKRPPPAKRKRAQHRTKK